MRTTRKIEMLRRQLAELDAYWYRANARVKTRIEIETQSLQERLTALEGVTP